jgi:hypothetical protein
MELGCQSRLVKRESLADGIEQCTANKPENGRADGFLDVLGNPPVVFFLEIANRNQASTASNGELGF